MAWDKPPSNFSVEVRKASDNFLRRATFMVLRGVVLKSPVGNPDLWAPQSLPPPPGYTGGQFRANWNVAIGNIDRSTKETIDKYGGVTIALGQKVIKQAKFESSVFISNTLPYALRIEDGWSTQAAEGVVSLTLLEVSARLKGR